MGKSRMRVGNSWSSMFGFLVSFFILVNLCYAQVSTIQGTVRDSDSQSLQGVEVLLHQSGEVTSVSTTNDVGYYRINNVRTGFSSFVRVRLKTSRNEVRVGLNSSSPIWKDSSSVWTEPGQTYTVNLTFNSISNDEVKGGILLREMTRGWRYVLENFGYDRPDIVVGIIDPYARRAYATGPEIVFPPGRIQFDNGVPSSRALIDDAILHEYAHAIQWKVWGNSFNFCSHRGRGCRPHGGVSNSCSHDALLEGWADYFPVAVYSHINPNDRSYDSPGSTDSKDLEFPESFNISLGEKDEWTFARALWDIDDDAADTGDTLALGEDEIWNIIANYDPRLVEEFYEDFTMVYPQHLAGVRRIWLAHRMSPPPLQLTSGVAVDEFVSRQRWAYYSIQVPTGNGSLVIDAMNATAYLALLVRRGAIPTFAEKDLIRTFWPGRDESVSISATSRPVLTPGTWFIGVFGETTGGSFTIRATYNTPRINLSPTNLTFNAVPGGANPPRQTLSISNSGGGTLNWSVRDDAPWLTLSPESGSSTGQTTAVTVSVNIAGMRAGTYNATITISASDATNSPQRCNVTLVIAEPPQIGRSPSSFSFSATRGGSNPPSQTLSIWNAGGGTLIWSVSDNAAWLTLSPEHGSSTGQTTTVTVNVNIAGLRAGTHTATIWISSAGASNSPQTCNVTLTVRSCWISDLVSFFRSLFSGSNRR